MRGFPWLLISASLPISPSLLLAQTTTAGGDIPEIIVTAQKREETVNKVPLSVTVLSDAQLQDNGIQNPADLARAVPSLTVAQVSFGASVFLIRGIGYYDQSIASAPAVSFYMDEAPLPFPAESSGVLFDIARVEVLKGPQGLLFGENSTGGAINVIAAKPTNTLTAGFEGTYGTFNSFTGSEYVSGPISDTLSVRIAARTIQAGPWQQSYSRDDSLGRVDKNAARVIFDWTPADELKVSLNVNGWRDTSQTQAGQYVFYKPTVNAYSPIADFPYAPANDRAADWNPGDDYNRDDSFGQANLRADYDLNKQMRLTSLTSFSSYASGYEFDADGTPYQGNNFQYTAHAHTFFQELRMSGQMSAADWLAGAQYHTDETSETYSNRIAQSTTAALIGLTQTGVANTQRPVQDAVYGNLNWHPVETVTLRAGARYSEHRRDLDYCYTSINPSRTASTLANANKMRAAIGLPPITTPLAQDACLTLGVDYVPSRIFEKIDESNTSWRLGADWQITQRSMVYASVTQGYKDGAFNASGASLLAQLAPVKPESLRSYEIGTKIGFDEAQVNAAVYHYDYSNKQILGFRIDPIQGSLNQLVNIPKAKVDGAEIELTVRPFGGLILTGSTNYNRSEVTSDFFNPDAFTNIYNFKGSQLPRSPEWAADADAEYDWTVTREKTAFVGAHANYTARDSAAFSSSADPRSAIFVDPTRTLIDLRLGIESARWRAMLWSRNITDKYYYSVYSVLDTIDRMAGMPRTFGITVSYKFQ